MKKTPKTDLWNKSLQAFVKIQLHNRGNTNLGTDDPNNVFTCKTWEKCCTVALKPACCATPEMSDAM